MTSALPEDADLLFEKKQAKALLKACRAGDPAALSRVQAHLSSRRGGDTSQLTLADAQFVIARERGFPSWPKLKAHISPSSSRPNDYCVWHGMAHWRSSHDC